MPMLNRSLLRYLALSTLAAVGCTTLPTRDPQGGKLPPMKVQEEDDAPEISRSAGQEGGVVVLWPRIIPKKDDEATMQLARALQGKLAEVVAKALPDRPIDVRPAPERVCPRAGCDAMTVGAVLTKKDDVCGVVALVSGPGQADQRLVAYGGEIELRREYVPFREPPENEVILKDLGSCTELIASLAQKDAALEAALVAAAP